MPDVFLTPEELLARWRNRVSMGTLQNWRYKSKGPRPTKIGGKVLYAIADVERYERAAPRKIK